MNRISEIQVSNSNESVDKEENENNSMGWRCLLSMIKTSEDCD